MTIPRATVHLVLCLALAVCAPAAAPAPAPAPAARAAEDAKGKEKDKSPATRQAAKTHTVKIKGSKFSPASLTIKAGDTVVWANEDDRDHLVVADDKSFKSDNISPDGDFEHTFKKAGTLRYACKYHPREKATITVEK